MNKICINKCIKEQDYILLDKILQRTEMEIKRQITPYTIDLIIQLKDENILNRLLNINNVKKLINRYTIEEIVRSDNIKLLDIILKIKNLEFNNLIEEYKSISSK